MGEEVGLSEQFKGKPFFNIFLAFHRHFPH